MTRRTKDEEPIRMTHSSGNVFADLGFENPEEELAKAEISILIERIIASRGWTQRRAAEVLGVAPPDVSDLVRGKLARFSMERLERFLLALGMDVTIHVAPKAKSAPRGRIATEITQVLESLETRAPIGKVLAVRERSAVKYRSKRHR